MRESRMERERFGRDRERENSPSTSFGQSSSERTQPMGSESEEEKPAKSFLRDFVDKIPDPVKDAIDQRFRPMIGRVEK